MRLLLASLLVAVPPSVANAQISAPASIGASATPTAAKAIPPESDSGGTTPNLNKYAGQMVTSVSFTGVDPSMLEPLQSRLPLQAGEKLDTQKVRESLRTLYATGLYQSIQVIGVPGPEGIALTFSGAKKYFVGRITIDGVNNDNLLAQLNGSTKLNPGTVYTEAKLLATDDLLKQALEDNGYYEGTIARTMDADQRDGLANVHYTIQPGTLARVGDIKIDGDPGMTLKQFRRKGGLRHNSRVSRNTVSSALSSLQKIYQKKQRLSATVTLASKTYDAQGQYLNYEFRVTQGPVVNVTVSGAKISKNDIRKFVPIYEEGAVDLDLINEGAHNIRNYLQSKGYFDATVIPQQVQRSEGEINLRYVAETGVHHRVDAVTVTGNKYFNTETIKEHISVYSANIADRNGGYSQALVASDVSNITSLYEGNGFSHVKVTPEIKNVENKKDPKHDGLLSINYAIVEGEPTEDRYVPDQRHRHGVA